MSDGGSSAETGGTPKDALSAKSPDILPVPTAPVLPKEAGLVTARTDSATRDDTGTDSRLRDPNTFSEDEINKRRARIGIEIDSSINSQTRWLDNVAANPALLSVRPPEDLHAWTASMKETAMSASAAIIENLERRGVTVDRNLFIQYLNLEIAAKVMKEGLRIGEIPVPEYRARTGNVFIPVDRDGNYAFVYISPMFSYYGGDVHNAPDIHQTPLLHGLMPRKYNTQLETGIIERSAEEKEEGDPFNSLAKILHGPEPFKTTRADTNVYAWEEGQAPFTGWQASSELPKTKNDQYALVFNGTTRQAPGGGMPMISGSTNREISRVNIKIDRNLDDAATQQRVEYYRDWLEGVREASGLKTPVCIYKEKGEVKELGFSLGTDENYEVLAEL